MKEEKQVLMISESDASFLVNSIKTALENKKIKANMVIAQMKKMNEDVLEPSLVIVQGGDYDEKGYKTLVYLKDVCYEQKKRVILFGNKEEVERLKRLFPESLLDGVFIRPLEVAQVVELVEQSLKNLSKRQERKHVLVVDDSGMMLRTIMGWLEGKYNVSLANSAASAFTSINQSRPDLILLDYEMPVCSGAQFMEMLRAESATQNIPVIFLTSKGDAETVKSVLALHPEGYLLKTTPSEQVVAAIDQYFANRAE